MNHDYHNRPKYKEEPPSQLAVSGLYFVAAI